MFEKLPSRLAATLTFCLAGASAQAFEIGAMTEAERADFRSEIRAYLLENPEVLMEAIKVLEGRQANAQTSADKTLVKDLSDEIFNDGRSWVGGNPDGDIKMVEFLDYRCGYCRKAHDDVASLLESDGNIRFIVKEFPILGEDSVMSSRFAIATRRIAGDEAYARANYALMKMSGTVNAAALQRLAREIDVDAEKVMAEMNSDPVTEELSANRTLAQKLAITGTPTFIMEDELIRGYVPLASMQEIVKDLRATN